MSIATKSAISTAILLALGRASVAQPTSPPRPNAQSADDPVGPASKSNFSTHAGPDGHPTHHAVARVAASGDSRYVRFVEAVQALRIDPDMTTLSQAQVDRIMESARFIFMLDDGVPKPVEPPPRDPPANKTATASDDANAVNRSDPGLAEESGAPPAPSSHPR